MARFNGYFEDKAEMARLKRQIRKENLKTQLQKEKCKKNKIQAKAGRLSTAATGQGPQGQPGAGSRIPGALNGIAAFFGNFSSRSSGARRPSALDHDEWLRAIEGAPDSDKVEMAKVHNTRKHGIGKLATLLTLILAASITTGGVAYAINNVKTNDSDNQLAATKATLSSTEKLAAMDHEPTQSVNVSISPNSSSSITPAKVQEYVNAVGSNTGVNVTFNLSDGRHEAAASPEVEQAIRKALSSLLTSDAEWAGNKLVLNPYGAYFRVPNSTPETTDDDLSAIDEVDDNGDGTYTVVTRSYGTCANITPLE